MLEMSCERKRIGMVSKFIGAPLLRSLSCPSGQIYHFQKFRLPGLLFPAGLRASHFYFGYVEEAGSGLIVRCIAGDARHNTSDRADLPEL
jgi:hypothetical protein